MSRAAALQKCPAQQQRALQHQPRLLGCTAIVGMCTAASRPLVLALTWMLQAHLPLAALTRACGSTSLPAPGQASSKAAGTQQQPQQQPHQQQQLLLA